jgi:hypothetical protein
VSNNSSLVACVFVAAIMFLPSRCIATIEGFLPGRCLATIRRYTYRHRDYWEGFIKDAVAMGSGAMTKIHKDRFSHSKIDKGGYTDMQTACGSHKPTF